MQRRAVALDRRLERQVAARARIAAPWSPSTPLTSTTSPGRARSAPSSRPRRITPMPAVVRNSLSQAPLVDDLGVAGDDRDAGLARRRRHRAARRGAAARPAALLDDRGAGEVERHGAADGEVVDRAADRELADVAAGKEQRVDDVGVGREGEPVAARGQSGEVETRLVVQRRQQRVVEGARRRRRRSGPSSPCRRRHAPASRSARETVPSRRRAGRGDGVHAASSRARRRHSGNRRRRRLPTTPSARRAASPACRRCRTPCIATA